MYDTAQTDMAFYLSNLTLLALTLTLYLFGCRPLPRCILLSLVTPIAIQVNSPTCFTCCCAAVLGDMMNIKKHPICNLDIMNRKKSTNYVSMSYASIDVVLTWAFEI